MSITAVLTMLISLGLVWGGFIYLLTRAYKYEKMKGKDGG
jgi:hypothetical protein